MKFIRYLLLILLPATSFAQTLISGRIISQSDTKPVANVSVFLDNATIGAKTADDGTFVLKGVKPGKYKLVVSIIGFDRYDQLLSVGQDNIDLHDITIFPKAIALNEVKIKPKDESNRDHYYTVFRQYFLGSSDLSQSCDILNPQVLDFDQDDNINTLTASSTDFLVIRNEALGYKISYLLKNFTLNRTANEIHYDGSVLFTTLEGSASQEKRWQRNRQEAYANSSMHFLRSAISGQAAEAGFQVQLVTGSIGSVQKLITTPLSPQDFFKAATQKGIYDLFCSNGALFISYSKSHRFNSKTALDRINDVTNNTSTLVSFNTANAQFDANGVLLNPADLVLSGAWGNKRIADLLPSDYEPPASMVTSADTLSLKGLQTSLAAFNAAWPAEKAYLHLNKPVYFPGDTIWYKAYVVVNQHRFSQMSDVLHVELTGPTGGVLTRETLNLFNGASTAEIVLPRKPAPAGYRIRAYTNWMRNRQVGGIYNRQVLMADTMPAMAGIPKTSDRPDVQFFPEGGYLVDDVRSKVAIKAISKNGLGQEISGTVTDNEGNQVTAFKTQHLGMGVFAFIPQAGKKYTAKISAGGGPDFSVDLPPARAEGYALAINNSQKDSIYIKVAVNAQMLKTAQNASFYVLAQADGKIYYTSAGKLNAQAFSFAVEKSRFPSGIVQFTLFSGSGQPLNERIAFVQQDDTLKLKVDSAVNLTTLRQCIKTNISAVDPDGKPAIGTFSVSVYNESLGGIDAADETTIFNNLLLTSEVKGYVEHPNYYFLNPTDQTRADLDLLMLTQGYRRYDWKDIDDKNDRQPTFQPEKSLTLAGIVQSKSGKSVANRKVSIAATQLGVFKVTATGEAGNFEFKDLDLPDSTKMLFKTEKGLVIKVKRKAPLPADSALTPVQVSNRAEQRPPEQYQNYLQLRANDSIRYIHLLRDINIKAKKGPPAPDVSGTANLNGAGHADQVITEEQLDNCINLSDCLVGKLSFIDYKNGAFYAQRYQSSINVSGVYMGPNNSKGQINPAMVMILDGEIMDSSYINTISPKDVKSVEVLLSGAYLAIYGMHAAFGALVITTKRGSNTAPLDTNSTVVKHIFNGLYRAKVFYSPQYRVKQPSDGSKDLRTTLFWEPYLITDSNGKASFSFYNGDIKGAYRVVIEGIDGYGNLGRMVYRYKVE